MDGIVVHYVGRLAECGTVFDCAHAWPTQENKTLPLIVHLGKGKIASLLMCIEVPWLQLLFS